jgi:hypothetical protein
MEAKELRIGNLIYDTRGKVNEVNLNALDYMFEESLHQCKPIYLNREWLIKFGFKELPQKAVRRGVLTEFVNHGVRIEVSNSNNFYYKNRKSLMIVNVHTLQNLYFALTREELTIKE